MNLKILASEGYMFYIVASNFLNVFGDYRHKKNIYMYLKGLLMMILSH